jgi:hypothetical protein
LNNDRIIVPQSAARILGFGPKGCGLDSLRSLPVGWVSSKKLSSVACRVNYDKLIASLSSPRNLKTRGDTSLSPKTDKRKTESFEILAKGEIFDESQKDNQKRDEGR